MRTRDSRRGDGEGKELDKLGELHIDGCWGGWFGRENKIYSGVDRDGDVGESIETLRCCC